MAWEFNMLSAKSSLAFLSVLLIFIVPVSSSQARPTSGDPCGNRGSNAEERECYSKEQAKINTEAEALVGRISAELREDAKSEADPKDGGFGDVIADSLRKSAQTLLDSQKTWRAYREQYCKSVEYSFDIGVGARTAYEACMFQTGTARLQQLQSDFNPDTTK
jgi:uncharacterized protein YecT (DUF1311 family)